jgi:hypothetical protein
VTRAHAPRQVLLRDARGKSQKMVSTAVLVAVRIWVG